MKKFDRCYFCGEQTTHFLITDGYDKESKLKKRDLYPICDKCKKSKFSNIEVRSSKNEIHNL